MVRTRLVWIALFSLVFSNCGKLFRGYPSYPDISGEIPDQTAKLLGWGAIDYYNLCSSKILCRNEIVDARMAEIDNRFALFERKLYERGVGLAIGTDWLLLAITVATATVGGGSTKVAFGAISTGIAGAKASFDKHAFFDEALPTLFAEMVAQRETIRANIREKQNLSVESYTLYAALSDLEKFKQAGSITGSLHSIAEGAGQKADAARQRLRSIKMAKFMKSVSGDLLYRFWKPDGTKIDENAQEKIKEWMENNGLDPSNSHIPIFIYSDVFAAERINAVKDLGLKENEDDGN